MNFTVPPASLVRRCAMAHMWGQECEGESSRRVFGRYDGPLFPELHRDLLGKSVCDFHAEDLMAISDAHWSLGRAEFQRWTREMNSISDEPVRAEL